jgi:hypothetical protein
VVALEVAEAAVATIMAAATVAVADKKSAEESQRAATGRTMGSRSDGHNEGCDTLRMRLWTLVTGGFPESCQALRAKVSDTLGLRAVDSNTLGPEGCNTS